MPSLHKSAAYKPLDVPNPFREGQDKAYADILQDKMKETRWWRGIVGAGVLILSFVNFCFFVYAVRQQKTVPVLINVMPSGESQYLGEVRQSGVLQVPEAAILFQVRKFITNLRSISTDYQVVYNNIDECYVMITSAYAPILTRMLRDSSPFDLVGKVRRTVEVESALNITARSYQIDWIEATIDSSSSRKTARMRALVTIQLIPATDATIKKNPLGIYIENCEMTELCNTFYARQPRSFVFHDPPLILKSG
jgi:type IV secretion system protein VirB5